MSPQQVASYLQIPVTTLYQWRHRGDGPPAARVGRYLRYRETDVRRWLEQRVQASNTR
nr:helix-turn-helix domain-containing protein [Kineococcus aurantiacus]